MATKKNIEEQVAELTKEQQDKVFKVGKASVILLLVGLVPWLIISVLGFWTMFAPPAGFDYDNYDILYIGMMIWLIVGAVCIAGVASFIKIKYPYYSGAKWNYICKSRNGK